MSAIDEETPLLERSTTSNGSLELEDSINRNQPKLKETLSKLTRSEILCLIALAFGNFSVGTCVSLQAPFFPAQAEKKGATASEYGFVFGVYQVSIFLFAQVFGKMIGCVPPYIISTTGVVIVGVSSILFGLLDRASNSAFIPLAVTIRLLEGVGSVAIKTASYAIVGVKFEKDIATVFGVLETCFGVGLVIGPALGGLLFQIGGYMVPFVVVGCLLLIDAAVMFLCLPRDCGEIKRSAQLWKFWKHPPLYLNVFTVLCTSLYIGLIQTSLEPHLRKFNLSPFALGCIFIICGAFYSVLAPVWGRLCDKGVNPKIFLLAGCIFGLISPIVIGPVAFIPLETELWMVILGIGLLGVCLSFKQVSTFILCLRHTISRGFPNDVTTYGLISTMFSTSQSIGAFVGPTAGGYFHDVIGFRWTLLIIMGNEIILITALLIYQFCATRPCTTAQEVINDVEEAETSKTSIFESSYPRSMS